MPLPKSVLNRNKTQHNDVYDLLTPAQTAFALNMFRLVPGMDAESFNKALRYLKRANVFAHNLSALMDGINGLKNDLGQHSDMDWFDQSFSDIEDQLQELSEAQEFVEDGSTDESDDEDGEDYDDNEGSEEFDFDENNACGYSEASPWSGDLWSNERARYSRMNFNKVLYSDVTIEEVDSGDLLANETYESHDSDNEFLCHD